MSGSKASPSARTPRTKRRAAAELEVPTTRSIGRALGRDPDIKRYLDTARQITVRYDRYRKEAMTLHAKRKIKGMDSKRNLSVSELRYISGQEAAVRHRLIEMMEECERVLGRLKTLRDATMTRVMTVNSAILPGTSKTERREYLAMFLGEQVPVIADLEDAIAAADYVMKDIDQGGYTVNRMKELYELHTRPDMTH